jgi:DNA mismatch repair protein MutS
LNSCQYILEKILKKCNENPPAAANKGGLIAPGIHAELDELRTIASGGKNYLLELQQQRISEYRYLIA